VGAVQDPPAWSAIKPVRTGSPARIPPSCLPPPGPHLVSLPSPPPEDWLHTAVFALVQIVEVCAVAVIFVGAALAFVRFVGVALRTRRAADFVPIRLDLGRFLVLGLELQLAADLLRTAVAPSFEEIGKLAAVAAIRTALNFFLGKEIEQERKEVEPP
jgi:uncharacterized membrane protein